jgi:hypothetical protein
MSKAGFSTCIVLIFVLFAGQVCASTYGNSTDCLQGCPPGNNSCSQCCSAAFRSAPCDKSQECIKRCSGDRVCWSQCVRDTADDNTCLSNYKINFDCPDWVDPHQKCPYTCQTWNPLTRVCVGLPSNTCPPK